MKKFFLLGLLLSVFSIPSWAQTEVRLIVHKSFSLPKDAFVKFEKDNDAKVILVEGGNSNEMLNKLILSRAKPIADAVYGLDNANIGRAVQNNILAKRQPQSKAVNASLSGALAIDYGYININYDKKWFAEKNIPLPQSMQDLTKPIYKNLLVVPNPATSGPGLGFLMANISGMGEKEAFNWWASMRQNGVKIAQGWGDAYYTDFTQNGGDRPLVVSYATSPAAEVFFSKGKFSTPPTGNLFLKGGVFRQVEGAAVLNGAKQPDLAIKLVSYLQNEAIQKSIPEKMWVYPAVKNIPLPEVFKFAVEPKNHTSPSNKDMTSKQNPWVGRWTKTVLH